MRCSHNLSWDTQETLLGITVVDRSLLPGCFPDLGGVRVRKATEAREEIQRAVAMTQNRREQEVLTKKLKQMEKTEM